MVSPSLLPHVKFRVKKMARPAQLRDWVFLHTQGCGAKIDQDEFLTVHQAIHDENETAGTTVHE